MEIKRKTCPLCGTPCILRSISCFDKTGEKYGAMFLCPRCSWDDWGTIIQPNEILDFYEKEGTTYEEEVVKEKLTDKHKEKKK